RLPIAVDRQASRALGTHPCMRRAASGERRSGPGAGAPIPPRRGEKRKRSAPAAHARLPARHRRRMPMGFDPTREIGRDELESLVGRPLGVSDWMVVDQRRVDAFADVTEDHQFIHVDPVRAAETPFGGTIAHGLLTLSLIVPLCIGFVPKLAGTRLLL